MKIRLKFGAIGFQSVPQTAISSRVKTTDGGAKRSAGRGKSAKIVEKNEAQYLTKVLAAWHANRRGLTEVRHEHELLVGRDI